MTSGFFHRKLFTVLTTSGTYCELRCRYCESKYLSSMEYLDLRDPYTSISRLLSRGVKGILISGGFNRSGILLNLDRVLELLPEIRRLFSVVTMHPGFVENDEIARIISQYVDVVDLEFTLSPYIAQYVRNLDVERYVRTLETFLNAGAYVVPHVFLWHPHQGRESLVNELAYLRDRGLNTVTLLVFICPEVPSFETLKRLLDVASKFDLELYLGCMRPSKLKKELDLYAATESIVSRIANPHPIAWSYIDVFYDACCSIPQSKLNEFLYPHPLESVDASTHHRCEEYKRG